jgi:hypothetical protein
MECKNKFCLKVAGWIALRCRDKKNAERGGMRKEGNASLPVIVQMTERFTSPLDENPSLRQEPPPSRRGFE